jgi:hypothetical protein
MRFTINRKARPGCTGSAGVRAGPGETVYAIKKRSGQNGKIRPGIDGERLYILLEDISYVYCILTKNFQYAGPGRRGMPGA